MRAGLIRRTREDRGAVLIIASVFIFVAVVLLAAVVDLGAQRAEKKEVTLSTDAAALAAAAMADTEDISLLNVVAGMPVDCADVGIAPEAINPEGFTDVQEVVDDYLLRNGESNPVDCKVARTSFREGYVLVSADEIVDYAVGPALGIKSGDVGGVSVAAIEVNMGGGLRPVGICGLMESLDGVDGYPVVSLMSLFTSSSGGYELDTEGYVVAVGGSERTTFTARFPIDKVKGGDCGATSGGGSGNFGKLDFDLSATSTDCDEIGHFCHDYENGYYGAVLNPTKGDTGNNWSNKQTEDSTDYIISSVGQFWAPVHSVATGPGGNALFTLTHYVQLEMVNYCFTGGCKFDGATWFDFRVSRMIPYVPAGPPATDDANKKAARICAVTDDLAKITAGCPQIVVTSTTLPPASSTTLPPACAIAVAPQDQSVAVDGSRAARQTNGAVDWDITIDDPEVCGEISGAIVNGGDSRALASPSAPAASLTFVLPDNTPIPNGKHNKTRWSVRFFSDGVLISDTAELLVGP